MPYRICGAVKVSTGGERREQRAVAVHHDKSAKLKLTDNDYSVAVAASLGATVLPASVPCRARASIRY